MTYHRSIPELTQEEALSLGLPTFVWGHCQMSWFDVPGHPDELYIVNWITDPEHRGEGHARALFQCVLYVADVTGVTLVVHPDDERLCRGAMKYGFVIDPDREEWEGKPLLVRKPQEPAPEPPEHFSDLVYIDGTMEALPDHGGS